LNERFTQFADLVTEAVGQWWFTTISFLLLVLWIVYGMFLVAQQVQDWFTSTQWNFPLNTVSIE
jgi:uncharacterized membrane protein